MTAAASYPQMLVMLALDGRDATILEAVATIAPQVGTRSIVLAHVSYAEPLAGPLGSGLPMERPARPAELDDAASALAEKLPGITIDTEHGAGQPDAVLGELIVERDLDLLVMGRSAATGSKPGWGPSGQKLLRNARCSSLVVPDGSVVDLRVATVGLDFSHHATDALAVAAQLADSVVAVTQFDTRAAAHGSLTDAEFTSQLVRNARRHFEEDVAPELGDNSGKVRLEVIEGDRASEVLLERASGGLVVVGSRGLSKIATLLLGSTAEGIAGRATGPVLIVRKKGEVLSLLEGLFHR